LSETDYNDLAARDGLDAVRSQIDDALTAPEPEAARTTEAAPEPPAEWPVPMIPGNMKLPDFPVDILPGPWGAMAKAVSESTQTPPALSVMSVLGVLASLFQRRFEVSPYGDDYTEPLSLWVISASPSGTRKSGVLTAFRDPFLRWEKLQYDRYRVKVARAAAAISTAKKRIEALNQQAAKCKDSAELQAIRDDIERETLAMPEEVVHPRLFTGDTTAERLQAMLCEQSERMTVHCDEPGILRVMAGAYSGGAQNLDVFLQGHAGSAMRVDRAGRTAHVDKPALSFNLMIQPGMLSELAGSKGFRDSGLLARFLWAIPDSNVGTRDVRKHISVDAVVKEGYHAAAFAMLYGYLCEPGTVPTVRVLELSDSARNCWLDFSQYIEDRQGDGGEYEAIRDWTSKLAGAVARIAALLTLARHGLTATEVDYAAMDDAVILAKVLIPHAKAAFGMLGTDPTDVDALAVLKWIQGAGQAVFVKRSPRSDARDTFTRRDVQHALQSRFASVERLKKAMERLDAMDCVREFKRANRGAKESVCFQVNQALLNRS
jgi:replicative DNA helicase